MGVAHGSGRNADGRISISDVILMYKNKSVN